jgi:hypothetical protein
MSLFIVAPVVSMGTCLSAKVSPSNGRVYLLIKNLLPSSEFFFRCLFRGRYLATALTSYSMYICYIYIRDCEKYVILRIFCPRYSGKTVPSLDSVGGHLVLSKKRGLGAAALTVSCFLFRGLYPEAALPTLISEFPLHAVTSLLCS